MKTRKQSFILPRYMIPTILSAALMARGACAVIANDAVPQVLGCPTKERYPDGTDGVYARNVWSLTVFEGRLYIGDGNSSNLPPAPNAGPATVWTYDPATGRFATEGTVPDEQIDLFRTLKIDGSPMLVIPSHDPEEDWTFGNLYLRARTGQIAPGVPTSDGSPWRKLRTIPNGVHVFDVLEWPANSGTLLAALGTEKGGVVARSLDGGLHWQTMVMPDAQMRAYRFVPVGSTLYVASAGLEVEASKRPPHAMYRMIDSPRIGGRGAFERVEEDWFPGLSGTDLARAVPIRVTPITADTTLYIGARNVNDQQWEPRALYAASLQQDKLRAIQIPLPHDAGQPYDLRRVGDRIYCLACRDNGETANQDHPNRFCVSVYSSAVRDIASGRDRWKRVLTFPAPTFARSFELLGDCFYFGLGCDTKPLVKETGEIWRVAPPVKNLAVKPAVDSW